jgi:NADPH-dependent curcumin reductase CurA
VLLKTLYLSVDPYMRGRMSAGKSYTAPVEVGQVMEGGGVGQVIESRHTSFNVGDYVLGSIGWQEYAALDGKRLRKLDPALAPLSTALGVLGMPGLTAYFGLLAICDPQPGETVVVSGAAGAVGSLVGQIAKIRGCRVIGIAGTDAKVAYLVKDLGFDASFNYKTTEDYVAKLGALCPEGVDVYFDNVGGVITDAVFRVLNTFARVSICRQISQYNLTEVEQGPRLLSLVLTKQLRVEGFIVSRFSDRSHEGIDQLAQWLREGRITYREEMTEGFDQMPDAFFSMLKGGNTGKQVVKVGDPT